MDEYAQLAKKPDKVDSKRSTEATALKGIGYTLLALAEAIKNHQNIGSHC